MRGGRIPFHAGTGANKTSVLSRNEKGRECLQVLHGEIQLFAKPKFNEKTCNKNKGLL